jgi:hypothetical protein
MPGVGGGGAEIVISHAETTDDATRGRPHWLAVESALLQVASTQQKQPGGQSKEMIRAKGDLARHARGGALPEPE